MAEGAHLRPVHRTDHHNANIYYEYLGLASYNLSFHYNPLPTQFISNEPPTRRPENHYQFIQTHRTFTQQFTS